MTYKLFCDDERNPVHCVAFLGIKDPIYFENEWVICRNYVSFCNTIKKMGLPEFVSFDHDLGEGEDGVDCAKFLVDYCMDNKLKLPPFRIHSQNPVGSDNILSYLKLAEKWL